MESSNEAIRSLGERFRSHVAAKAQPETSWFRTLAQRSWNSFAASGLPGREHKDWLYTSLRGLSDWSWPAASEPGPDTESLSQIRSRLRTDIPTIVIFNGKFLPELSSVSHVEGLEVLRFQDALTRESAGDSPFLRESELCGAAGGLLSLNQALSDDALVLNISEGRTLPPISVMSFTSVSGHAYASLSQPHLWIIAEAGSSGRIYEEHIVLDDTEKRAPVKALHNGVSHLILREHSQLHYRKTLTAAEGHYHIDHSRVLQYQGSHIDSFSLCTGGKLVRHDQKVWQLEPEASCHLSGLFLSQNGGQAEQLSTVHHHCRDGKSQQQFRGVLADESTGVFLGSVKVAEDAQKVDARQLSRTLLCGNGAKIYTCPDLEINADDVRCSHGATVSQLRDEELFYCKSRGISEHQAKTMLSQAFAEELLYACQDELLCHIVRPVLTDFCRQIFNPGEQRNT